MEFVYLIPANQQIHRLHRFYGFNYAFRSFVCSEAYYGSNDRFLSDNRLSAYSQSFNIIVLAYSIKNIAIYS